MKFNSLKTKILQIFQYNICSFSLSQNSILKLLKAKPMILMAFLSLISIFPNSVFAQEGGCGTLPSFPILEPGALPIQCGFSNDILNNIDKLPYHIVKVNIHWIQNKNGENFEPNNPDEKFDGNKAAKNLLLWANYDLRDFGQHPNPLYPASQSFLHDSHIKYELYTDPSNPNDKHGGIWYWDKNFDHKNINSYPYKNDVINIVMHDNYNGNADGEAFPGNSDLIYIYRVYNKVKANPLKLWDQKQVINHELGHICSLDHTFEYINPCDGVDIDADKECNITPTGCNHWSSGSNSMMGYNQSQNSISPCQWIKMYSFLMNATNKKWLKPSCPKDDEDADIVIDNNKNNIWDKIKLHNGNILIKTGSQLTLRCLLKLGPSKKITVERGAKLLVDGGRITKLCDEPWRAIFVHGNPNKKQPDPEVDLTDLAPDDAGIVDFRSSSVISWARTAVSTDDWDLPDNEREQIWGGVVRATNTTFLNNRRVAEFMQYKKPNRSYFGYCSFEKNIKEKILPDVLGITMWDTKGIRFYNNNTFGENIDRHILGIDCSAIVDGNSFLNSGNISILTEATYPYHTDMNISKNTFTAKGNDGFGIVSRSGNDSPLGFNISGNTFNGTFIRQHAVGIQIENSAATFIFGNIFDYASRINEIQLVETGIGPQPSIIKCNSFQGFIPGEDHNSAIQMTGNNEKSLIVGNIFDEKGKAFFGNAIDVSGDIKDVQKWANILPNPFSTGNYQQLLIDNSPALPASNIFNTGLNAPTHFIRVDPNINPIGLFIYKTPEDPKTKKYGEKYYPEPTNGNYKIGDFKEEPSECSPSGNFGNGGNLPPFSSCNEQDIVTIRTQITSHQQQNNEAGGINEELSDLHTRLIETVRCAVYNLISNDRYEEAEEILLRQPDQSYHRFAFGLKVERGNYDGALQVLHTLPSETTDNQWFIRIQEINIQRFKVGFSYRLNAPDEAFLTEVANSTSTERGYARALLDLLKGYRNYPNDNVRPNSQYRSMKEYTTDKLKTNQRKDLVFISPNPITEDYFQVNTKDVRIQNGIIRFRDIMGNIAMEQKFTANPFERVVIDCSELREGLYAVQIFDGELIIFEGKISMLR